MSDGESTERVEALEQQVAELEATVRGLTEELVDRTERIRQLEDEHDLNGGSGSEPETTSEPDADEDKSTETEGGDESDSESGDDIIVA